MKEVSGNVLGIFHRAAERYAVSLDAIFTGLDVSPDEEPERFGWETFCTLCERLGSLCTGRAPLDRVGELLFEVPGHQRIREVIQLVASPRMLYWASMHWAGTKAFLHVTTDLEDLPNGQLRLTIQLPDQYRDSPEFFQICEGIFRATPKLIGLPCANVTLEIGPRVGVYTVTLPPSLTLWARMRRGVMLILAPRAVLAELRDQNEELRARFEELAAAREEAERLRLEAERARDDAQVALRVKSEFLTTISHELRTPLNGIMGLTDMLLCTRLDGEQRDIADTLLRSADTLFGLISDVLDFSKIEAGKLALNVAEFDPVPVVRGVVQLLSGIAHGKGLALTAEAGALPARAIGDSERVRQVLVNLVGNALKFTERGSVSVEAAVVSRDEARALLRFTVRDTGIGMSPDALGRIFEPFTQVDTTTRRRFGGSGLGLAICKQLVAQMGGEIGVETVAGRGSSFWFTVPVGLPSVAAAPVFEAPPAVPMSPSVALLVSLHRSLRPPPSRPKSLRPPSRRPRSAGPRPEHASARAVEDTRPWILLVDDNAVNLKVAAHALTRLTFNVVPATNGAHALELFISRTFDAVLMDCQMPEMDGYEATARIRAAEASIPRRTPIIAVTANATEGDRARCLAAGMDDYIPKPLKIDLLRNTLTRWLGPPSVEALATRRASLAPGPARAGDASLSSPST